MIRGFGDIKILRFSLSPILPILLIPLFLLPACGKKGDPTLKSWEKPDSPSRLKAIHRESEIILQWNFPRKKEQFIKGFILMKSTGGDFEKIEFLENNQRTYRDGNFTVGTLYRYKVLSQNLRDILSDDSNIVEAKPEKVPFPPGKLQFKIEHETLTLTWEDTGKGIVYNIYKSEKKGLYPLWPINKEPIKEKTFKDVFNIKKPVFYTIRSLRGGEIWSEGSPSDELEINPSEFIPSAPQGLQAAVSEEKIYLIWKEVPETWVIGYRVYREIDTTEGFVLIEETQTPSFIDTEKPLIKRTYRVTALGPAKEGPPTEIKDVVFVPYR